MTPAGFGLSFLFFLFPENELATPLSMGGTERERESQRETETERERERERETEREKQVRKEKARHYAVY